MNPTHIYIGHIAYKLVTVLNPVFMNISTKFKNCKMASNFTFYTGKIDNELLEKKTPI